MKKLIALIALGVVLSSGAAFANCGADHAATKSEEATSTEQIASTEVKSEETQAVAENAVEGSAEIKSEEVATTQAE